MLPIDSVLLDAQRPGPSQAAGALLFTQPLARLVARTYEEVCPLLAELDRHAGAGRWCAGYLAYEAAYALDPTGFPDPPQSRGPLAWFGVYDGPERLLPEDLVGRLPATDHSVGQPQMSLDKEDYERRVEAIRQHIVDGDVYQINLTAPFDFRFSGDPSSLYAQLRRRQQVPYGGMIRTSERWILSLSPELFVRRDGDQLMTMPMKGTVQRGATSAEDRERAEWLAVDEKNRAENLMIVDLLRNDLSRVARPGSVRVPSLFDVERYETLWQMTSTVGAEARPGMGVADVLEALFPCGSVTGAPKRRAMQLIRDLEVEPRGVYCGALGVVKPGGDFVFNVPIRTVEITGASGRMGVGSGIVWDSNPAAEFQECILKARFLTEPPPPEFSLLETMRAEAGIIPLLDLHLARLRDAAGYFDFQFDEGAIRQQLEGLGRSVQRVRLTLAPEGTIQVETSPIADADLRIGQAAVYPEPVYTNNPLLRHKTTHREFYDQALAWAHERGADEAILLNERGEVADGSFTSVWIRADETLFTPPLSSGGLPGVYRAHLLETRDNTSERILRLDDLRSADQVLVSNAVRGLQEVELLP